MNIVEDAGPSSKCWPEPNTAEGVVCHSMEGGWAAARARLFGTDEVSWHFSVLKDGTIYQAYGLGVSCWHAGNHLANTELIGIEHEGVAGEPLTPAQLASSVELVRWIAQQKGWPTLQRQVTLWEHHEVVGWATPNAGPTTCPNGRIPWNQYTEEGSGVISPPMSKDDGIAVFVAAIYPQVAEPGVAIIPQEEQTDPPRRIYRVEMPL